MNSDNSAQTRMRRWNSELEQERQNQGAQEVACTYQADSLHIDCLVIPSIESVSCCTCVHSVSLDFIRTMLQSKVNSRAPATVATESLDQVNRSTQ